MGWTIFQFILGITVLYLGAKLLVFGAMQLAVTLKISSLIIGLTVVAFGTSAPEIAFCSLAAIRGETSLLLGNIIGSNIVNILLVLGLCASISPLIVKKQLIRWDVPIMIGISLLVWIFGSFGFIYRTQGILLIAGIIFYMFFLFYFHKKNHLLEKKAAARHPVWLQCVWIILGLICLGFGSDWLIKGSSNLASLLGVGELFIGLTVVAIGTSLPEIATSMMAISKNEKDLAVGNAIGSNIFNLLAVLGIAALISPNPLPVSKSLIAFDLPIMVAVAIATLPIVITGHLISRWEGILFLFYYLLYITYLLLDTFAYPILPLFTSAFFFFILPLTLITLIVGIVRHVYRHH